MKIGFLLYSDMQLMDVVGPLEVLNFWHKLDNSIQIINIAETLSSIPCSNGFSLLPDYAFATAPKLDYLCVPGGVGRIKEVNNLALLNFIKTQSQNCKLVMSVCTGAFLLAAAGLLKNKRATTYWRTFKEFMLTYPDTIIEEERIVKTEKVWTSGGVSSGIDLMLELVKEVAGESRAGQVQLLLEYFPLQNLYAKESDAIKLPPYYKDKQNLESHQLPGYLRKLVTS